MRRSNSASTFGAFGDLEFENSGRPSSEPSDDGKSDELEAAKCLPGVIQLTAQNCNEMSGSEETASITSELLRGDGSRLLGLGAIECSAALDRTENRGMFMAELNSSACGTHVHLPVIPVRAAVPSQNDGGQSVFSDVEVCYVLPWAHRNLTAVEDSLGHMQGMWGPSGLVEDFIRDGSDAINNRRMLPPGDRRRPEAIFIKRQPSMPLLPHPQESIKAKESKGKKGKQLKGNNVTMPSSTKVSHMPRSSSIKSQDLFNALTSVDLSGNQIGGCLPLWLLILPELKYLDLTGNNITAMPVLANSSAVQCTEVPLITANQVSLIGPKLHRLSLARNSFSYSEGVLEAISYLLELRELNLDNFMTQNAATGTSLGFSAAPWQPLASLNHLKKLSFEGLALGCIPHVVLSESRVEDLCVRDCALRVLNADLVLLGQTLRRLDVSGNQLKSLDPIVGPGRGSPSTIFPYLEEVVASSNELADCSLSILSCPRLVRLDLESNEIRVFTDLDTFDVTCLEVPPPVEPDNSWKARVTGCSKPSSKSPQEILRPLEILVGHNSPELCPPISAFTSPSALQVYLTDLKLVEPFLEKHRKSAEVLAASDGVLTKLSRLRSRCAAPLLHAVVPGLNRTHSGASSENLSDASTASFSKFCSIEGILTMAPSSTEGLHLDLHLVGGEAWPRLTNYMRRVAEDSNNRLAVATIKAVHKNGSVDAVIDIAADDHASNQSGKSPGGSTDAAVGNETNCHESYQSGKPTYIAMHGWLTQSESPVPYVGPALQLNARFTIKELSPSLKPLPPPLFSSVAAEAKEAASGVRETASHSFLENRDHDVAAVSLSRKKKRQERQILKRQNSKEVDDGEEDSFRGVLSWLVEVEFGDSTATVELQTPLSAQKHYSSAASNSSTQSTASSLPSAAYEWWSPPAATVAVRGLLAALAAAAARQLGLGNSHSVLLRHAVSITQRTTLDSDMALATALVNHAVPSLHRAPSASLVDGTTSSSPRPFTPGTPEPTSNESGHKMKRSSSKSNVASTDTSAAAARSEVEAQGKSSGASPINSSGPVLASPLPRRGMPPPPPRIPGAAFESPFALDRRTPTPSPKTPDGGQFSQRSPTLRRSVTPHSPPPPKQVPLRVLMWPARANAYDGNNRSNSDPGNSVLGAPSFPSPGSGHISSASVVGLLENLCSTCRSRGEDRLRSQPWDPDVELLAFFCAPRKDAASGKGLDDLPLAREIKRLLTAIRPAEVVPAARFPKDVADYLVGVGDSEDEPKRNYSPRWITFSGHARTPSEDPNASAQASCPLVFQEYSEKKAHGEEVQWPATPSVDAFVEALSNCTRLEGVFLNACYTESYAVNINRRLPEVAVVAWSGSINDNVVHFYTENLLCYLLLVFSDFVD